MHRKSSGEARFWYPEARLHEPGSMMTAHPEGIARRNSLFGTGTDMPQLQNDGPTLKALRGLRTRCRSRPRCRERLFKGPNSRT